MTVTAPVKPVVNQDLAAVNGRWPRFAAEALAAEALAEIATIAILQHRGVLEAQVVNDQLQRALNSRVVIEQAKGIVADRKSPNMDQALPDGIAARSGKSVTSRTG